MASSDVDIDSLNVSYVPLSPTLKYAASAATDSSRTSSAASSKAHSMCDDNDADNAINQAPPSSLSRCNSSDYRCMQLTSSFDVQEMMSLRESNYRDSLIVSNESTFANSCRVSEMGSALMRMDESYRRVYSTNQRRLSGSSPDGLTPLLQAARAGDIVLVNALAIQAGTDILRRDPMFGQTALHFAIRGGHLNVVQALLMPHLRGSIVNVADNRRNTALHLAAAKSRRMTKILLECGADVNFLNMRNQTPLGVHILTSTKDDPTMTEVLLQHRANPNAPVDKSTILHVALDKGLIQVATRLVRHGARLDLKDESGKTVFDKVDHDQLKKLMAKVAHSPVWIPDNERPVCMECHKKFGGLSSRRHHCRICGRVLCSACSACKVRAKNVPFSLRRRSKKNKTETESVKIRVCNMCYDICREGMQSSQKDGDGSLAQN
ncbi:myosin-like protein [Plasmopara halstedii]|uniref:Myosin-like protein n=1 Tax=Plasmopara halstedii TaxID=4781 RepID=A0A0P1ANN1_PLAHL|nr:myosin-like protein [Plasmopara halstedii]CEG42670.1 myosin-like protein [Plasmopara halstedii]|eukprot:XP_024579039.1 myosin-like protein [Plasmopara halstedii]